MLGVADSNVRYVGDGQSGAMLSAGTRLDIEAPSMNGPIEVDLARYNFSATKLGKWTGRGYAGGSACIYVNNFAPSAAELFFRPNGARSVPGASAYGPAQKGTLWVARSPNRASGGLPAVTDWARITSVQNRTLTIEAFLSELKAWEADLEKGGMAFLHGLWAWNWADSHRPLQQVSSLTGKLIVGDDDINRDVNPIRPQKAGQQGGYVYAYGLQSMLDSAGEYHIDPKTATLRFFPPEGNEPGTYSVSRLQSAVVVTGAFNISFENLEIRYSRGAGVQVDDSTNVVLRGCTVSDNGMMGVNITGGKGCGVEDSEVAANGDAGIVLAGGDRISLTPSNHYVRNCSVHHNHRWIMNYSPDVMLAGVGQLVENSDIYGSPQIGVFFQGNDHTMRGCHLHDVTRQCSDCGAFYCGREWTYRGLSILETRFSALSSIFGQAHGLPSAVYLDDQLSSVRIEGCFFDEIDGRVLELGGGRHNDFIGNLVKQSAATQSISMDDRGGGGTSCCSEGRLPYSFLSRVPYNTSESWAKYIDLPHILSDAPCVPKHNRISDNILCGGARNFALDPATVEKWGSEMLNNTAKAACPPTWRAHDIY